MEVVWTLENVKGDKSFYSRFNLLMIIASVSLWRKYHPTHKTVIYLDDITYKVFSNLDILHLWHENRPLIYPERIKRSVFWSGSKTKIISETNIPLLVVDHDFLIFRNIDEYLKEDLICTYDEIASNWYPLPTDKWGTRLTTPIRHIIDKASNVSLFYLPDSKFANRYGKQTLKNHIEFSSMDAKGMTPNHMIYSEQFMLRQWIEEENIPYKTLCKNIWDCKTVRYTDNICDYGIWEKNEALKSFKHYGIDKRHVLGNKKGYNYTDTLNYLYRCINAGRLIDIKYLQDKIKLIEGK